MRTLKTLSFSLVLASTLAAHADENAIDMNFQKFVKTRDQTHLLQIALGEVARNLEQQLALQPRDDSRPQRNDDAVRKIILQPYALKKEAAAVLVIAYLNLKGERTGRELQVETLESGKKQTVLVDNGIFRTMLAANGNLLTMATVTPKLQTALQSFIKEPTRDPKFGGELANDLSIPGDGSGGMNCNLWALRTLVFADSQEANVDKFAIESGYLPQTMTEPARKSKSVSDALRTVTSTILMAEARPVLAARYGIIQVVTPESILAYLEKRNKLQSIHKVNLLQ